MRIVSEGGRTWGVIEDRYRKIYVPLKEGQEELELVHNRDPEDGEFAVWTLDLANMEPVDFYTPEIEEPHGRTCTCFPCEQARYRMDRDDPSVGGYDPTN